MKKWILRTALGCAGVILLAWVALLVVQRLFPEPHANGRPLSEWLVLLRDGSPTNRQEAVEALRSMGPEAIPYLTGELTRAPNAFQRAAGSALPYAPSFLKRPLQRIQNPGKYVAQKHMALQAIKVLGTNAAAAAPTLGEVLRQRDVALASAAATALIYLGTNSVPELIASLDDGSFDTRSHACYALAILGKDAGAAVPRLGQIVLEERGVIAATAAFTLGRIGEPAVPVLIEFLSHTNVAVRRLGSIALAIGSSYPPSAVPALIEAAKDPDAEVRAAAVQAVGQIDRTSTNSAAVLVAALDDPNANVRRVATEGAVLQPRLVRENQERFYTLLEDETPEVRVAAARALGQTGQHGSPAIPKLERMLKDGSLEVRQTAAQALATITNSMELVKGRTAQPPIQVQNQ